ncbi:MAG: hypothetical protein K2K21_11890 [Lachnospiraceae bacterium]|nr:hypothetical protein [Lachnospiraceae bacterium]
MIQIMFKHPEFMVPILILLSLSIICQISMGVLYHKLITQTENMSSTKNKSLQQLKLKFSSCCQLHDGMSNVPVFVDKYMNKIKIYGISLSTLKHLSGQLVLLSILISGIAACIEITAGETVQYIVPYYIVSFLGLYCYFAISSLVDISAKTNTLRTNLIDYLENHLANRLEQTSLDLKLIQGDVKDAAQDNVNTPTQFDKQADAPGKNQTDVSFESQIITVPENSGNIPVSSIAQPALTKTEAQELESLLKEFLA